MRIRRSFVLVCSLVLVASIGTPARAAPGDLDPTFSSDGIKFAGGVALRDLAVQPDGRIVVVGRTTGDVPRSVAMRFTADGALDPSFSGDGRAPLRITAPSDVALQSDGRVVVAGMTGPGEEPELVSVERLTARGTRDLTFSGDGWATAHLTDPWDGYFLWTTGLAIDTLGRITVVVESLEYPDDVDRFISLLLQWEPTGARRLAFGTDGVAWARRCDEAEGLAVQPDRKLVVAGVGADDPFLGDADYDPCVTRLNANGTLDGTFGTNGFTTFGPVSAFAHGVRVSPATGAITMLFDEAVARVHADGSPDASFGTDGVVTTSAFGTGAMWDLALQGSKVIIAGWSDGRWTWARLTGVGALDPTFGTAGVASVDLTAGDDRAVAVEVRNGTIVTTGLAGDGGAVVRLLG